MVPTGRTRMKLTKYNKNAKKRLQKDKKVVMVKKKEVIYHE